MRSYIVIPEGTPVVMVTASTPHYAASKAHRGKATPLVMPDALVLPVSRTLPASNGTHEPIPGQLTIEQARG